MSRMMTNNAAFKARKEANNAQKAEEKAQRAIDKANGIEPEIKEVDEGEDLTRFNNPDNYTQPLLKMYVRMSKYFWELAYGRYGGYLDAFIITVIIMAGAMVGVQTYPDYECPAPDFQDTAFKEGIYTAEYTTMEECDMVGTDPLTDKYTDTHDGSSFHYDRCAAADYSVRYCARRGSAVFGGDGTVDQFIFWTFLAEVVIKIVANGAAPWNYWVGPEWRWNNFDFVIVALSVKFITNIIFSGGGGGNLMILRLFRLARLLKLVGKIKKLQQIVMGLIAGIKAANYIAMLLFLVFYIFAIAGMMAFRRNDPFHFRTIPVALLSLFRAATMEDWTDIMYISIYGCDVYSSGIYYDLKSYDPTYHGQEAVGADSIYFDTWEEVPNYFKCNKPKAQPALSAFYWIFFIMVCSWVMLALFVGAITIAMSETMDEGDDDDDAEAAEEAHRNKIAPSSDLMATTMKHIWNKYAVATGDRLMPLEQEAPQYRLGAYSRFAELNRHFAELEWFQTFVTLTILAAGVTVGVDTELLAPEPMGQNFATPAEDASSLANQLWYWDTVINWIFTVEVTVKLVGEDWHPWTYFEDGWNVFDFIIVATSWLPVILDAAGAGGGGGLGALKLLRLLRLFRIMRVVKKLPELTVIVEALLVAMESIGFIALIIFVVFYLFAILGMMLFEENDPWHYGKLHRALLTLMRISTFEDWTDVMYINVYGCAKWGYNDDSLATTCTQRNYTTKWWAAFYFIVFIFLGSFTLITLFVGVVTTSMEEAQGKQRKIMEGERDTSDYLSEYGVPSDAVKEVMDLFAILDTDEDGEVSLTEFMAACKCVTELEGNEKDFPAKLLLEDAGFCDDKTGGEIPERGNPFTLMKYTMNYMARCAGSKATFTYQVEEADEAAVAALAQAEAAKKTKLPSPTLKKQKSSNKGNDLESTF